MAMMLSPRQFRILLFFVGFLAVCISVITLRCGSTPIAQPSLVIGHAPQPVNIQAEAISTFSSVKANGKAKPPILSGKEDILIGVVTNSYSEPTDHTENTDSPPNQTTEVVKQITNKRRLAEEKATEFLSSIHDDRPVVNPHPFHFTDIVETDLCDSTTEMLIIMMSAPGNQQLRYNVRESFAKLNLAPKLNFKIVFGFGLPSTDVEQDKLIEESNIHHDMIQENYMESYHNLSIKSVSLFKWASIFCPSAQYIVKTDDDMLLDIYSLGSFLYNYRENPENTQERTILCNTWFNGSMPVIRNPNETKYYVSKEEYVNDFYSTYCSGIAYILTPDMTRALYIESLHVKKFKIDDFYITGLLPLHLNATYVDIKPYTAFRVEDAEADLAGGGTKFIFIPEANPIKRAFKWKDIIFNHSQGLQ